MKIYFLSPQGVPMNQVLFPMFEETFRAKGHHIMWDIIDSDIVFIDLHTRISDYDQADVDWLLNSHVPIVTFDEWDRGNMSSDVWPHPKTKQQQKIFNHIADHNIKAIHFCRLLDSTLKYPTNIFPYEKPILYEEEPCNADELFNREYDICFIANTSPSREAIAEALRYYGRLKCNIYIGGHKHPFDYFLKEHKKAKLFVSSGAGGFTDERKQLLFSVAGIIQERTNQLVLNSLTNIWNCLKINNPPTEEDLDIIYRVVNDKKLLYAIYKDGIDFMKKYYSKEYIANNILETIKANNIA